MLDIPTDTVSLSQQQRLVRDSIRDICADFDPAYWRQRDRNGEYPHEFVAELADGGWFGIRIPEEYDVERYLREARLTRLVPIAQELVLNYVGEKVLGLPRSY